jgi:tetratricopeptide (TPR) repeat protein
MGENEQEPAPGKPDAFRQAPSGIQPILSPRRGRSAERGGADSGHEERLAELNDLVDRVHTLSGQIGGNASPEHSPPLETREKPLRRWKKVVRLGVDPLRAQPAPATDEVPASASSLAGSLLASHGPSHPEKPAGSATDLDASAAPSHVGPSAHASPAYVVPRRTAGALRSRAAARPIPLTHRHPFLVWGAAQAFCFALVLVGVWVGQYSSAQKAGAPESGPAENEANAAVARWSSGFVSEQAFQKINEVLAAGKKGDSAAAQRLIEDAERQRIDIPGAAYRLALIAIQRGDQTQAEVQLDRAAGIPAQRAAAAYISAAVNGSQGNFTRAATMLETAVYAEPFSARYLFFWGEALRRAGKLKDAIERLEWAQSRPASPADAEFIAFKCRLAKIEAGRESEFAAELEGKLKLDPVPAYWLLTAAAQEVQRTDFPAAARFLQKVARILPADELNQQMRDYFFTPLAARKEFAPYFARSGPPPVPITVISLHSDPAAWTLQSGDPAAWTIGGPAKVH